MNEQSNRVSRRSHTRQSLRGQIMILFAVGVVVLIGGAALAVDVGFLMAERRQNQAAVDAAALSAAKAMLDKEDEAFVEESGQVYGSNNAGVAKGDVIVEPGDETVRVTITKDVQKFFLNAIYGGEWQVTNTAVAAIEPVQRPYALVALNPCSAASSGLKLNGGPIITVDGQGSILSNCNISNTSNAASVIDVGGAIDAVGTIDVPSNAAWNAPDGINPNANAADDPLAGAIAPNPAALASREVPACVNNNTSDACVIDPGRYTDKTLTPNKTICMKPGIYYLDGTTRIQLGNNGILTNRASYCPSITTGGVLIYVTGGASIKVENGKIILSTNYQIPPGETQCDPAHEPYTGAPCGLVLWIANGSDFLPKANAVTLFEGVFYAPQSSVRIQGSPSSAAQGMQVIVGTLELGGGGAFNLKYTHYVTLDRPSVFLVE